MMGFPYNNLAKKGSINDRAESVYGLLNSLDKKAYMNNIYEEHKCSSDNNEGAPVSEITDD